jgi:hypothetical protein
MKTTQKTKDRTKRTPQNMRGLYDWVSSSCLQMYIEHGIKKNKGIFNRHHICRVC